MLLTPFLVLLIPVIKAGPPKLIWSERFDVFDLKVWNHLVTAWDGGNNEFQYYRNNRKNSYVKNGCLYIKATPVANEVNRKTFYSGSIREEGCNFEPCTSNAGADIISPFYSARIRTKGSFSFAFGRIEVRAKMPRGDWLWPAIWMLPEDESIYGGWPAGGEIDIAEIRGNKDYFDTNGKHQGIRKVGSTLHFGPNPQNHEFQITNWDKTLPSGDFSDDFHTFGMEWRNTSIAFTLDGQKTAEVDVPPGGFWELGNFSRRPGVRNVWEKGSRMAPFDKPFHIIINLAVGGRFFPDGWQGKQSKRPWSWGVSPKKQFWDNRNQFLPTWDRPELIVDHILVYSWDD